MRPECSRVRAREQSSCLDHIETCALNCTCSFLDLFENCSRAQDGHLRARADGCITGYTYVNFLEMCITDIIMHIVAYMSYSMSMCMHVQMHGATDPKTGTL